MGKIINECEFKGSPLESTLTNTKKVELHYNAVKYALQGQPDSKFWKEAFELISKRNKKLKGVPQP